MTDAIGDIIAALKVEKILAGAGSSEIEIARELRHYSESLSGREQLAVKAFRRCNGDYPRTLAENSGLDPITCLQN